ncbi:heme exporter protein CcmD [Roseobacter ponti]|uniref:Heme exporter protein D n=2 Tax=Roseobacter ponti TaxID=1891787 RepID=A0A858SXE4_9RHOB|nr:heme exporter protein CcmD [Roseobacter ponti]
MMPDLGKYADAVLSAYGASLVLLALLVFFTLRRGRKARAALDEVERGEKRRG